MLRKKVKLLLKQLQVCIFAEIVFGVRCTLKTFFCIMLAKIYIHTRTSISQSTRKCLNTECSVVVTFKLDVHLQSFQDSSIFMVMALSEPVEALNN